MADAPLDPNFYSDSSVTNWPRLSVVGFTFDRVTGVLDFSAVPGFDLSRVQTILALVKAGAYAPATSRYLYARPVPTPYSLAEVDGVPVSAPPTSGKVIKVKPDTSDIPPDAKIIVFYDP